MPNGNHQLEHLIEEAIGRVAEKGTEASHTDIMLAGFGYLAYQINRPQWYNMRRVVPIAFGVGSVGGIGILGAIMRFLGG